MIATLPRRSMWLVVTLSCVLAMEVVSAQTRTAADGPWVGWVRCEISAQGAGYTDRQTHTWVMTGGAPRIDGAFRVYPATWSVVGGGSLQPRTQPASNVTGQWTTNGESSNAPIAVWMRGDGRIVFTLRHEQIRVPNGFAGFRSFAVDGKQGPSQAIAAQTEEYRFQPIDDAPANSISGSTTLSVPSSNAYAPVPQPGSTATASCSWQFVQSATPIAPPSTSSAAATGTTTAPRTLSAAGSGTIQTTATQTTNSTDTTTTRRDQSLPASTLSALTTLVASAPTVTITPAGEINGALSGPTKLTPGAKGTFQLTLTAPGTVTTTVMLPSPPPTQIPPDKYSMDQIISTTTSTTAFLGVSLTFDSNEGETATPSLTSASNMAAPSATFTFQTAGTYSVSVSGTVTVQTRLDIVNTITTTIYGPDGSGTYCNNGPCYKPISTSTRAETRPTQTSIKSYQVSARLQLTVAAQ
ncbi:MAG TPA: hypothetical protein VL693_06240 [Vicinamibacterales bacterium]|jgi:hypothetical protein|nr:hypothetical protein [Vicinamibacterales bacterium]